MPSLAQAKMFNSAHNRPYERALPPPHPAGGPGTRPYLEFHVPVIVIVDNSSSSGGGGGGGGGSGFKKETWMNPWSFLFSTCNKHRETGGGGGDNSHRKGERGRGVAGALRRSVEGYSDRLSRVVHIGCTSNRALKTEASADEEEREAAEEGEGYSERYKVTWSDEGVMREGEDVPGYDYIPCDFASFRSVRRALRRVEALELSRVDYLVFSGQPEEVLDGSRRRPRRWRMTARDKANESDGRGQRLGEEEMEMGKREMDVWYTSRWMFIDGLLPLLEKGLKTREGRAGVLNMLWPPSAHSQASDSTPQNGNGNGVGAISLSLREVEDAEERRDVALACNELMMDDLAELKPDITFTSFYPGKLSTQSTTTMMPRLGLASSHRPISPEECAEYVWFSLFSQQGGRCWRNEKGNQMVLRTEREKNNVEEAKALWKQTQERVDSAFAA